MAEGLSWRCDWTVRKYTEDDVRRLENQLRRAVIGADLDRHGVEPYADSYVPGNLLTTAGLGRITSLIIGGGGQALSNTATRIGVGDGSSSAVIGDTDLGAAAGSTHRYFQPADVAFPSQSGGVITVQATYTSSNGNFAWNEFGIDIGTPTVTAGTSVNALLLNHKTGISQGTKSSGQTWVATATITIS